MSYIWLFYSVLFNLKNNTYLYSIKTSHNCLTLRVLMIHDSVMSDTVIDTAVI